MLPEFYLNCLSNRLTRSQVLTLEIFVWLLQVHKQVRIERLASQLPIPILFESRRRKIQRFLKLPVLSVPLIWFPIIQIIVKLTVKPGGRLYLALDRTQWQDKNLFVVAVIMERRALPIYWQFLDKRGASNLGEQQAILRPALRLFKQYDLVVLGDREFHSVELGKYLHKHKVKYVFRQKKDTLIQMKKQAYQSLESLKIAPGVKMFLTGIKVTKHKGFARASIGIYWQRKTGAPFDSEAWYLLTNLPTLEESLKAYRKRMGIEAMFKDCQTGGYNLEASKASIERLTRLVLLIAIAYTSSSLKGKLIKSVGCAKYIGRRRKVKQLNTKNSNFWIGLYGDVWTFKPEFVDKWVSELMRITPNKLPFYRKGIRAKNIIQQTL